MELYLAKPPAGGEEAFAGPVAQALVTGLGSWRGEGMAVVKVAESIGS